MEQLGYRDDPADRLGMLDGQRLRTAGLSCVTSARREGASFDITAFHSRALAIGGLGLDTLRSALLD